MNQTHLTFNMYSIFSSLLCISLYFTGVQLFEFSIQQQIDFLEEKVQKMKCWMDPEVLSRQVFAGKKTSIIDFLQVSKFCPTVWPVKKQILVELNHLVTTVLSCEYCALINYFNNYMLRYFEECHKLGNENQRQVRDNYNTKAEHFENIRKYVKTAIDYLTVFLTHFSKFINILAFYKYIRSDEKFSNRDELKILLTWYVQMQNIISMEFPDEIKNNDLNIMIKQKQLVTNITMTHELIVEQMTIVLKEFDIKYCRLIAESNNLNKNLSLSNKQTIFREFQLKLDLYVDDQYFSSGFVFDLDRHHEFLYIIETNTNLKAHWNNHYLSPREMFDKYIKNSTSLKAILQYVNLCLI